MLNHAIEMDKTRHTRPLCHRLCRRDGRQLPQRSSGIAKVNFGAEYAIMGGTDGTSFVDISNPENPVYLGNLPGHNGSSSLWRDIKVYDNHAFIVSEASNYGMQVFDLTELRNVSNPPVTFSETAHYDDFGNAHNIVINEENSYQGTDCR